MTNLFKLVSRFAMPKSEDARLDALSDPSNLAGVDENDPKSVAQFVKKIGREMGEVMANDFEQVFEQEMIKAPDNGGGGANDSFGGSDE